MAIKQAEDGVRAASDRFYDALTRMTNGDAQPVSACWSHGDDVTTMHPIGGREVGWDEVEASWQGVADVAEGGTVRPSDRLVRVFGDTAYELVTENAPMGLGGEQVEGAYRATNVYRLDDGEWRIVHHHTDVDTEFVEIIQRLND